MKARAPRARAEAQAPPTRSTAQEFIGFSEEAMNYNRQYTIVEYEPGHSIHRDVLVGGIRPTIGGDVLEELAGGVFTSSGDFIPACLQPRSDGRNAIVPGQGRMIDPEPRKRIPKAIFGGVLFDHFGHFLLESTARLWLNGEYGGRPWLFLTDGRPNVHDYQRNFLEILGLDRDQVTIVTDLVAVDDLVIPAPAFVYHHWASRTYLRAFRARPVPDTAGRRPIFLSRSGAGAAATIGEAELEEVLRRQAWTVVVPEQLAASEQVALFRSDNLVMGVQGSAMHLGLFGAPGRSVIHLCRGQAYRGYYLLDELAGANATYLSAMTTHRLESKPISGPFLLDLDATIAFLRDRDLISAKPVAMARLDAAASQRMDEDYVAWWNYTESQIRFYRQIAHDGTPVGSETALDFALLAVQSRPDIPKIVCQALLLTSKFQGMQAASDLLARIWPDGPALDGLTDHALLSMISTIKDATGDYVTCEAAARRAVKLAPRNPTYGYQWAIAFYRTDRLDEAEAALSRLIATDDAGPESFFLMSLIFCRREERAVASEWALTAVRRERANTIYAYHALDLLNQLGRPEEALELCRELLRHRPDDAGVLRRLGSLEREQGLLQPAADHLLLAYRLAPDADGLRAQCAEMLVAGGLLPDIGRREQPSHSDIEQAVMIYKQSRFLLASGSAEASVRAAVRSLNLFPGNPDIAQHLLGAMLSARRVLEMRLLAGLLIDAGLGNGPIHYALSLAEHELGRTDAARAAARQAAELAPDNAFIRDHQERLMAAV